MGLINADKAAFDNIQHPFMIKKSFRNIRELLQPDKENLQKPIANIMFND